VITKEQALAATHGTTFYNQNLRGADKRPMRCRVSGKCRIWVTRPDEFVLPVKYGMYHSFTISRINAHAWCATEEEAVLMEGTT
jgi:hypothetical protein